MENSSGLFRTGKSEERDRVKVQAGASWNGVLKDLHDGLLADTRGPNTKPGWLRDGAADFEKYFAPIGFEGVRGNGAEMRLILTAPQPLVVKEGMIQYRKRILTAMQKYFGREVQVDVRRCLS